MLACIITVVMLEPRDIIICTQHGPVIKIKAGVDIIE